ncbi:MAG: CopG family transcriptional regulator [Xenophilus sp.]
MRTTLDIDDDVLEAAKELSRRQRVSAGRVISLLARQALAGASGPPLPDAGRVAGGFRPFAPRGVVVTDEAIHALRDAEGV